MCDCLSHGSTTELISAVAEARIDRKSALPLGHCPDQAACQPTSCRCKCSCQVPGQAHSFIEHIQAGIQHAEHDPDALLLFSGGQTRKAAGPRSEAEGYWLVAEAAKWWGSSMVRERAFTEECAHIANSV